MTTAKHLLILIAVVLSAVTGIHAQSRSDLIRQKLLDGDTSSVIVASHRGDWRNFPENSLEGIANAIAMGVDIVELDVQLTKDSVLILMHDAKLNRTSTGKGPIAEADMDYIRTLNLRNGCNIRTIHKVPTLEEALLLAKGKVLVNLDKADRYFKQVYDLTVKTGTTNQIVMKGHSPAEQVREQFGQYLDEIIYMPIVNLDNETAGTDIEEYISTISPAAFELLYKHDSNPLPLRLKDSLSGRSLIWYNTLWDTMAGGHDDDASLKDPADGYGYLIDTLGARIIQTDRPQYLLDYLRGRGLHD